jgi:hypothetical protein
MSVEEKRARHYENMEAQAGEVSTSFHKVHGKSFGFLDSDQCFFLYSMSHTAVPPLCEDPQKPALNIVQAFGTKEAALKRGTKLSASHEDVSILLGSSHNWLPGCSSFEEIATAEKEQQFVDNVLSSYSSKIESDKQNFQKRVVEKVESNQVKANKPQKSARGKARSNVFRQKDQFVETDNIVLPTDEDQKVAVVAIAIKPDEPETLKYIFQFLRSFDKEDEADAYIRNTASERLPNYDIVTVRCGRYSRIELENSKTKRFYRDEKIQRIMDHNESQKQEVENFRQRCQDNEQEVPLLEISPDGVVSNRDATEFEPEPEPEPDPEPEPEPEPESETSMLRRSSRRRK